MMNQVMAVSRSEGARVAGNTPPANNSKGASPHYYNNFTTDRLDIEEVAEIISFAQKANNFEFIRLAKEVILQSPQKIKDFPPFLFGNVMFVGYVLGKRAERARRTR